MIEGHFIAFPIDTKSARQLTTENVLLRQTRDDYDLHTGLIVRIIPLDGGHSITRRLKLANTPLKSDEIGLHNESKMSMYGTLPREGQVIHLLIKPANLFHRAVFYATHSGLPTWVNNLIALAAIGGLAVGFTKWVLRLF